MKALAASAAIGVMLHSFGPCSSGILAESAPPAATSAPIEIAYVQPADPAFRPIYDRLRKRKVLEQLQQFLSPLRLPRTLTVRIEQCNAPNRPYTSGGPVTICYEHVQRVELLAKKAASPKTAPREVMMVGAFVQGMLHSVAHAVFDQLELPVWGRANDAADQLAAFMMLQFGSQVAATTIQGTAWFFEVSGKTWTGSDFADVNSPEAQRGYNFLCMAFGADQEVFAFLVKNDLLPAARARRCPGEYYEVRFAFMRELMPHVDEEKMNKVQKMAILMPGDVKAARSPPSRTTRKARNR